LPSFQRMSMIKHGFYSLEIGPMSFGEPLTRRRGAP
jgi:hypothetical protein